MAETTDATSAPATELDTLIAASDKRLRSLRTRSETLARELAAEEVLNEDLHARKGPEPTLPDEEPATSPPATAPGAAAGRSKGPARAPRHRDDDAGLSILDEPDEGEESSPHHLTVDPELVRPEGHGPVGDHTESVTAGHYAPHPEEHIINGDSSDDHEPEGEKSSEPSKPRTGLLGLADQARAQHKRRGTMA
jgi:hypothetical protein